MLGGEESRLIAGDAGVGDIFNDALQRIYVSRLHQPRDIDGDEDAPIQSLVALNILEFGREHPACFSFGLLFPLRRFGEARTSELVVSGSKLYSETATTSTPLYRSISIYLSICLPALSSSLFRIAVGPAGPSRFWFVGSPSIRSKRSSGFGIESFFVLFFFF